MFLNETLLQTIRYILSEYNSHHNQVEVVNSINRGAVNYCYRLQAGDQFFFLKVNSAETYPGMFSSEFEGLKRIRETKCIRVPDTIACGVDNQEQFLLMQWVHSGVNSRKSQQLLGKDLAALHNNYGEAFGFDHDNYIGSLPQSNTRYNSWSDFFINNRLTPQIDLACQKGLLSSLLINNFHSLFKQIDNLFPVEKPSLIHGDLWSGNYMIDSAGNPVLIDPAAAYGHREVDLAMTTLFGGFDKRFYDSYNHEYPLERGWKDRRHLWNLYPLLVHLNLFGVVYLNEVTTCLRKYL